MDDNILWKAFEWLVAIMVAVGAWVMRGMHSDVAELKRGQGDCELNLANFKTEAANTYAKDSSVQQSLGRLHERIDEVATDIKQILQRVK